MEKRTYGKDLEQVQFSKYFLFQVGCLWRCQYPDSIASMVGLVVNLEQLTE
jgi:hypothetical protein